MTFQRILFSTARQDWETPQFLYDGLNAEFGFDVDVCASAENAKCKQYFSERQNGLLQEWTGVCWMNPPYRRKIGRGMKKANESVLNGATVVCLVPARTDTRWWHRYAKKGEIRYLRGRLKFVGAKHAAPFPSAVVIFRGAKLPCRRVCCTKCPLQSDLD